MQDNIECYQHPRQPRRSECQDSQKAEPCIWVPPAPDVDHCGAERRAEECLVEERRDAEQGCRGVEEEVGEVCGGEGGFFEHAGVALDEEDVEEEVEGEGTEVDECG